MSALLNNLEPRYSRLNSILVSAERRPFVALTVWTGFYFALTLALARAKPLWNDELFTFYISRRPSMSAVWDALLTGAEQIPPFFFIVTRWTTGMLGSSPLSFRLPEVFGFWIMSMCLFCFVRVRTSLSFGLIAMTFPLVTAAFEYAYEARPYGLVLGFCGLALCSWQTATRAHFRFLALPALSLSIAAAVSSHYYAVLAMGAILVGELVRTIRQKRLDMGVALACALGFAPLLLFAPLISAARSYSRAFWAKPQWTNLLGFYNTLLAPAPLALFAVLILLGILIQMRYTRDRDPSPARNEIPFYEIAAVSAFIFLPVVAVILAKLVTGAFTFRYALPAVMGLSIGAAWSSFKLARGRAVLGFTVALALLGFSILNGLKAYSAVKSNRDNHAAAYRFLSAHSAGLPVVITGPHLFFELSHEAADRRGVLRPIYLADLPLAMRYTGTDTVERGLLALKQWAPLDVRDFRAFCESHERFLIYGNTFPFDWVTKELIEEGRLLTVAARNEDQLLFLVTSPEKQER